MKTIAAVIFGLILALVTPFALAAPLAWTGGAPHPIPAVEETVVAEHVTVVEHPVRPLVSATVYPGSLKDNILRIAKKFGWTNVVWTLPGVDFKWYGKATITAHSVQDIFTKLLSNYPVQARFYHGNHVLVIVLRNLP